MVIRRGIMEKKVYESVLKPDHELRQCARKQKCYDELMEVRPQVLRILGSHETKN